MSPDRQDGLRSSCLVLDFDATALDTEGSLYRSWAEVWEDLDALDALPLADAVEEARRQSPSGRAGPGTGAVSRSVPGC